MIIDVNNMEVLQSTSNFGKATTEIFASLNDKDYRSIDNFNYQLISDRIPLYVPTEEYTFLTTANFAIRDDLSNFNIYRGNETYTTKGQFLYKMDIDSIIEDKETLYNNNIAVCYGSNMDSDTTTELINSNTLNYNLTEEKFIIFDYNHQVKINQFALQFASDTNDTINISIYGSNDLDFNLLFSGEVNNDTITTLDTSGPYQFYKVIFSPIDDNSEYNLNLFELYETVYKISYTVPENTLNEEHDKLLGEIYILPDIFINESKINNPTRILKTMDYLTITVPEIITIFPTRKITLDIEFGFKNQSIVKLFNNLYTLFLIDSMENNETVEISSNNFPEDSDVLGLFDRVSSNTLIGTTDTEGLLNSEILVDFKENKYIYEFIFEFGIKENTPTNITISGSYDNETFEEVINNDIEIAVDNFVYDLTYSPELYKDYQFYKISFASGQPDTDILINQIYLNTEQPLEELKALTNEEE